LHCGLATLPFVEQQPTVIRSSMPNSVRQQTL
jgi:hypothetical protein